MTPHLKPLKLSLFAALCLSAPALAQSATPQTVQAQTQAQSGSLDVNGARIFYQVQGTGQPMLLIHGYPLSGDLFSRNRAALAAAGYKVITLDLRGYGRSVAPNVPSMISTYAQDALAVMDRLGVQQAIIGGMSMGGPTVLEMYKRAPQRFSGLILIDTIAAAANPAEAGLWRGVADQAAQKGVDSLVPVLIKDMLSGPTRLNQPAQVSYLSAIIRRASVQAAIGGAYALANRPDYSSLLNQIKVPTLVLVGEQDSIYPVAVSQMLQKAIPNAKLAIIPGAAHAAIYENADASNQAILDWVKTFR